VLGWELGWVLGWVLGAGMLACWAARVLGCSRVGLLACWAARVLGWVLGCDSELQTSEIAAVRFLLVDS